MQQRPDEPTPFGGDDDTTGPRPFEHASVMLDEVVALFAPVPEGWLVDATLGGAGHAAAILDAHEQLSVLGIDQDPSALEAAAEALGRHAARAVLRRARFDQLVAVVTDTGTHPVSGVLFDLGVSSPQFDRAERGFSYRHAGPLDMRMNPDAELTATSIVNTWSETDLVALLRRNSDERHAVRIARAIVARRPLATTSELADVVRDAIPAPARRTGGHPAKRTFQALRIEVNQELDILAGSVDQAIEVLDPGGRIAVLSYHSGEDRIVKDRLRHAATGGCTCPPALPCVCGATPTLRLLRTGGWTPSADEVARNPRAASARLRAGEKLAVGVAA
jgi:16S rRNA (cytosine1402-N4)-methyltransferase